MSTIGMFSPRARAVLGMTGRKNDVSPAIRNTSSGITWLALAGVELARMQRRAGHEDISTTLGYVKPAEDLAGKSQRLRTAPGGLDWSEVWSK
jgi:hypothetical protein